MMKITKELFDAKVHETMGELGEMIKEKDDGATGIFLLLFLTLGTSILSGKLFPEEEAKEE